MGRPVIVDDGGSIRIKLEDRLGGLPNLVTKLEDTIDSEGDPYGTARIEGVERNTPKNIDIQFRRIVISGNAQIYVEVTKLNDGSKLGIRVYGINTVTPVIEENGDTYTIANGGSIDKVEVDDAAILSPARNARVRIT